MTFLHGYPYELQTFPFLLTYLYIWGHSCPTAYISENSRNSWHHPRALQGRKSLKQQPVLKQEITTAHAQMWADHMKAQAAVQSYCECWCRCMFWTGKAYSRNPGLCLCSTWGPNWICAWIPANSQALSKETGWEPFNISSLAWRRHDESRNTHSGKGSNYKGARIIQSSPNRGS